jgi:hypothetical protein
MGSNCKTNIVRNCKWGAAQLVGQFFGLTSSGPVEMHLIKDQAAAFFSAERLDLDLCCREPFKGGLL